jgi:uncharacterized protein YbdZ (MbtH family)
LQYGWNLAMRLVGWRSWHGYRNTVGAIFVRDTDCAHEHVWGQLYRDEQFTNILICGDNCIQINNEQLQFAIWTKNIKLPQSWWTEDLIMTLHAWLHWFAAFCHDMTNRWLYNLMRTLIQAAKLSGLVQTYRK